MSRKRFALAVNSSHRWEDCRNVGHKSAKNGIDATIANYVLGSYSDTCELRKKVISAL